MLCDISCVGVLNANGENLLLSFKRNWIKEGRKFYWSQLLNVDYKGPIYIGHKL